MRTADRCTVGRADSPDALANLTAFYLHRPLAKLHEAGLAPRESGAATIDLAPEAQKKVGLALSR